MQKLYVFVGLMSWHKPYALANYIVLYLSNAFPRGEGITQINSSFAAVGDGLRTSRWYAAIPYSPVEYGDTGRRERRPLRCRNLTEQSLLRGPKDVS